MKVADDAAKIANRIASIKSRQVVSWRDEMAHPTTSCRAPREHHALIRHVAAAVTRDPTVAVAIQRILAADVSAGPPDAQAAMPTDFGRRLALLERRVEQLLSSRDRRQGVDVPAMQRATRNAMQDEAARWTKGRGLRRRLTPEGRAECERLLFDGTPVSVVARTLGISHPSVRGHQERLGLLPPDDAGEPAPFMKEGT